MIRRDLIPAVPPYGGNLLSRQHTHPPPSSCTLRVCEDTSRQHRRSRDRLDWDMLITEAGKTRKYLTSLKQ